MPLPHRLRQEVVVARHAFGEQTLGFHHTRDGVGRTGVSTPGSPRGIVAGEMVRRRPSLSASRCHRPETCAVGSATKVGPTQRDRRMS